MTKQNIHLINLNKDNKPPEPGAVKPNRPGVYVDKELSPYFSAIGSIISHISMALIYGLVALSFALINGDFVEIENAIGPTLFVGLAVGIAAALMPEENL
jgi:hypothetical protein